MIHRVFNSVMFVSCLWLTAGPGTIAGAQTTTSLRVMSYNIWLGGANAGPLSRTVGVIQTAQADIIGIQERGSNGQAIASALGYHYQSLGGSTAIISRFPIVQTLTYGVKVQLAPLQEAFVFDVHLAAYPYQPYDIRDGLITTEAQAIAAAQATRGAATTALVDNMSSALATGVPVFLTGDFNEPSHLDWTSEAAAAGMHFGMQVDWPASSAVVNAGLTDAFRELRPDEVADPAFTWTPGYPAPNVPDDEVFDRIDFVYYAGNGVTPSLAQTLGYNANDGSTDIAIQPYPSDHRAVVVEFDVSGCFVQGDINGDCAVNVNDWTRFRGGQHVDMTGLTAAQAYALGDINGDFRNDHADFVIFKAAFEEANGAGSFAAMLVTVPEPGSLAILYAFICICFGARIRLSS
ncbi:MAG: endonuclease/exonuclease/phosphatase family protein [Pirellulales bacterium]